VAAGRAAWSGCRTRTAAPRRRRPALPARRRAPARTSAGTGRCWSPRAGTPAATGRAATSRRRTPYSAPQESGAAQHGSRTRRPARRSDEFRRLDQSTK
jgi:hypothetical protein